MKTFKLTLAMCALATISMAQPFTGQSYYAHNGTNALLSSGTYVRTIPGFIMGGYIPSFTSAGTPNFLIDKVDPNGTFVSTTAFSREYLMYNGGAACGLSIAQETRCYGVSVIENRGTVCSNVMYAAAAAFDAGVLFMTLDNTGAIVNSAFYNIPSGAVPNVKPLIAAAANGSYYVCGSYLLSGISYVYAFQTSATGSTLNWSRVFDLAIATFIPRAIVEDTYPGFAELAMVGTLGTTTTDGFIMTLNGGTGAPIIQRALASGQPVNETLGAIALAASNNGYIVGGKTDVNTTAGHAWMARLNANGTFNWTSRLNPTTNAIAGEVLGVAERRSSAYNSYEYYGLAVSTGSTGGMMVLKVDSLGNTFGQPGNTNNEFVYNDGSGNIASPAAISLFDGGTTGANTGIHVFGNDQSSPSRFFLNQACFNGVTGSCAITSQQNLTQMKAKAAGPASSYGFNVTVNNGLPRCKRYYVLDNSTSYSPVQPCSMSTLPGGGNNNRPSNPTGTNENPNPKLGSLSVFPNPVSNITEVNYTAADDGEVEISLSDILGQQIKTLDRGYKNAGANALSFDMSELNLQTGVYFINVTMNGKTNQQKIIYSKN